jgi:PPOX class probable F420-dependent enzyme
VESTGAMAANQRAEIVMTDAEVRAMLEQSRTGTMATVGPNGFPHLVAMWYGLVDGKVCFETKTKSQKVKNLRRDPHVSFSVEAGLSYDQLRGVAIEGTGEIVEDPDEIWKVGVNVWERYNGPYTDDMKPFVETMLHKRVAVRVDVERTRSWDHRKLGLPALPLGGTTAVYL